MLSGIAEHPWVDDPVIGVAAGRAPPLQRGLRSFATQLRTGTLDQVAGYEAKSVALHRVMERAAAASWPTAAYPANAEAVNNPVAGHSAWRGHQI